jgi:archaellum component FlaC
MEDQKRVFNALMEEQKQTFTRHIDDLENEIKKLKVALKTAQEMSTSDLSNGGKKNLFSELL